VKYLTDKSLVLKGGWRNKYTMKSKLSIVGKENCNKDMKDVRVESSGLPFLAHRGHRSGRGISNLMVFMDRQTQGFMLPLHTLLPYS
jgi:hypothetical protein